MKDSIGVFTSNMDYIAGTLRHEVGHALDAINEWKNTMLHNHYQLDRTKLRNASEFTREDLWKLNRFTNANSGYEETIAELFAIQNGGSNLPTDVQELVLNVFAQTANKLAEMNALRKS